MKRAAAWTAMLLSVAAGARELPVETPVLPRSEYRLPPEEVIAIGRVPYWRQQAAPQWEKPEVELPESKSRLQWVPRYSRDERDEYNGIRDSVNPQPRTKIFEVHF